MPLLPQQKQQSETRQEERGGWSSEGIGGAKVARGLGVALMYSCLWCSWEIEVFACSLFSYHINHTKDISSDQAQQGYPINHTKDIPSTTPRISTTARISRHINNTKHISSINHSHQPHQGYLVYQPLQGYLINHIKDISSDLATQQPWHYRWQPGSPRRPPPVAW